MGSIFIFLMYLMYLTIVIWQGCRILELNDKVMTLEMQKEQFAFREQLLKDSYKQVKSMLLDEIQATRKKVKKLEKEISNQ